MALGVSSSRSVVVTASSDLYMHAYYVKSGVLSSFLLYPVDVLDDTYILNTPAAGTGTTTDVVLAALQSQSSVSRYFETKFSSDCPAACLTEIMS